MEIVPVECNHIKYRNFSLCRHCVGQGEEGLLSRLSESMPMISRSDGELFHLVLADRPVPYPAERNSGRSERLSLFFWYSHVFHGASTRTTVVVVPNNGRERLSLFRRIEHIADLLTDKLRDCPELKTMYELEQGQLFELPV